ncbi:S8 family serine peptidase [Pseudalkalibacillus caeni]|uniref:SLH domain-containing protein n=1 Tax=Exobacillus caeni TaxID=2574798 RepID=A0A5R9EZQ2_9BACL|nr:S8 family serine peptidase [Pseudalkalibacillus caeni]TLS35600.1 hypothetical protein FCL54_19790 [Pseudalkalibacillus caeni]
MKAILLRILLASVLVVPVFNPSVTMAESSVANKTVDQKMVKQAFDQLKDTNKDSLSVGKMNVDKEKLQESAKKVKENQRIRTEKVKNLIENTTDFKGFREKYKKKEKEKAFNISNIDQKDVDNRQILIRLKDGHEIDVKSLGLESIQTSAIMNEKGYRIVKVPVSKDYDNILTQLRNHQSIIEANPDYINKTDYVPTDPYYSSQWHLKKINMPQAWDITKGSSEVVVAVLDSGVNASVPDLQGRVLPGYDFVNNDADAADDNGHGTHVAGIIAANTNNIGVTGIDFKAKILPVKVADADGRISLSDSISGIYYAIDQGADIINMSFGGYYYDPGREDALWEAYNKGIVTVAAAGNEGVSDWSYPAATPPVINVSSTDENDFVSWFSNYGDWIDISAPGENILSTNMTGSYSGGDGTSFSTPIVTAIASLIKGYHPDWNPAQIEWAIENNADMVNGTYEWSNKYGFGRVNAYKTLNNNLPTIQNDAGDYVSTATQISKDQKLSHKMDLPGDFDVFKFVISESAETTITLSNVPGNIDLVGILHSDNLVNNLVIDDNIKGQSETLTFYAEPGTYYFAVYDYFNHWSSKGYNIDYTTNSVDSPVVYTEQEPNDSMGLADPIPYDGIGTGYFQTYEDYDFFRTSLPYNGDIIITTAVSNNAYYNDPIAMLFDESGNYIDVANINVDSDSELKYNVEIFENVNQGTYYVVLANYESYSDSVNPYLFNINYNGPINRFSDVTQYKEEINYLAERGIIKGYDDGTFKPLEPVKRLQAVQMILREMGVNVTNAPNPNFSDMQPGDYGYDEVAKAVELGIIKGKDGKFNPWGELTRAQMAKILVKAYELQGTYSKDFNDVPKTFWAYSYISALAANGITTGYSDNTFRPNNNISRQHFSVFMARYLNPNFR